MMDTVTLENINADVPFDEVAAMRQKREQEMVDLRILYHELSEGTFYEDYDEATRLVGVLRRHLERIDQRPGK
jgi:hypothetical protein